VRIDPALETLVPSDTVFLLGARIDKIRDTDIYRKYLSQTNPTQIQQFAQATGIDPRKDLDEALACYNGKAGLLLIRGAFNKKDVERRLESRGAKPLAYKGIDMFGDERYSVALIDNSTAAAGNTATLKSAIGGRDPAPGGKCLGRGRNGLVDICLAGLSYLGDFRIVVRVEHFNSAACLCVDELARDE